MPGQDLAFEEVAIIERYRASDEYKSQQQIVWLFRRATKGIPGLAFVVEPNGDAELAQLWQKHSARYAEAISQAWEAGDEDRLDVIAEEIEDAIEEEVTASPEGKALLPSQDDKDSGAAGGSSTGDGGDGGTDKA